MISQDDIKRIWSLPDDTIPSIHANTWYDFVPSNFRAMALMPDNPVPVTERRDVPEVLKSLTPLAKLIKSGEALLNAFVETQLCMSIAGGRIVYAHGTTILLIERKRDGEIIVCPWSPNESRKQIMKRLIAIRRAEPVRLSARESYIAHRLLPRCNAAISVVSGFDIENPGTNILASGGDCPVSVTIGTKSIHFALDHRIYDPSDAGALYSHFFANLAKVEIGHGDNGDIEVQTD